MKKMRKLLCFVLVFGLVFTSGILSFANDPLEEPSDVCEVCLSEECVCEPAPEPEPEPVETAPAIEPFDAPISFAAAALEQGKINVNWVQVINGGALQVLYRDKVYSGADGVNGEAANAYYTTSREFNLKDPRVFNVEFFVPQATVGSADPADFVDTVQFTYGGFALSEWGNGNNLRGSTPILVMEDRSIAPADGGYNVTANIRLNGPWAASAVGANVPYVGFIAGGQGHFGNGQTSDNRAWWQSGPANLGVGRDYTLAAVSGGATLAELDVHIGVYEGMYSWREMNEFSQSLIEAITGDKIPIAELDECPIGLMAAGYVKKDADGKYVEGSAATDVYVEVHIIGYGLTDNYKPENITFNNYSRFNAQWNIVVAKNAAKVDDYLKEGGVLDTINNDPKSLIDKYANAAPEDIDMVGVFYQNNVHSDEVTGTESMIHLIDRLIVGGQAGQQIPYKTVDAGDINWRYLYPAPGHTSGTTNQLIGGNDAVGTVTRNPAVFDTGVALDNFIFVSTLCSNPDGKAGMRRVNRYGIDLNRDAIYSTQPEAISLTKDIAKWNPMVMNEWHGYVGNMLIEPCTAPHAPTYEYDLLQNSMVQLAYAGGKAVLGSTGYNTFLVPWDHYGFGAWDDGGNVYAPMMAMLYGTMGYTIEFPHSNTDSLEAGNAINYAMVNALLYGETGCNLGNALNGRLPEFDDPTTLRDDHSGDITYASMRKESVMNLLENKLRGIENRDEMTADKYFIDRRNNTNVVVGRSRVDDGHGGKLPFFPDYLIIPVTSDQQYNVAEGIRALNFIMERGVNVSVSTADVTYLGNAYPAGSYVIDMRQGNRNFAFEVMGKGYDATYFGSMYADIYCNYPDVRGFDSVQVWNALDGVGDLFAGKLEILVSVEKKVDIAGAPADYVIFKSQSTDAVRFVNLLLSGISSGPSYSEKGDVWMLRNNLYGVENGGVGTKSDYVIKASDLSKIENLVDNPNLGIKGCHIVGEYINYLPAEAAKLVEPIITFTTTRTAQTGAALWWVWDDYLGFNMRNVDGSDYNGSTGLRAGSNVIVTTGAPSAALINAVNNDKLGLVLITNATTLTDANFGLGNTAAPGTASFSDVAVNGVYNVDDSLFSANYAVSTTMYGRGTPLTGVNAPLGAKVLFKTLPIGSEAFIGGFQATSGSKATFADRTMAISALAKAGAGKPAQILYIGQNMNFRSHYHKLYPMVATAIFAGAAGILDDQVAPVITSITSSGNVLTVKAEDGDENNYRNSGIADDGYALYVRTAERFELVAQNSTGTFTLQEGNRYYVAVSDWAGNQVHRNIAYLNGKIFDYYSEGAVPSAAVTKLNGNKNDLTITVKETFYKDGAAVFTRDITQTFSIDNNAAGTYKVNIYNVYVDTKGNTQIRECYISGTDYGRAGPLPSTGGITGVSAKFISIKASGSKVYVLSFTVTETFKDGTKKDVRYDVDLNANNANVSGKLDLGAYTLTYDIAGNGSNIKTFSVKVN